MRLETLSTARKIRGFRAKRQRTTNPADLSLPKGALLCLCHHQGSSHRVIGKATHADDHRVAKAVAPGCSPGAQPL
eukprot:3644660-Heterocapsa_arctica.AAC.1